MQVYTSSEQRTADILLSNSTKIWAAREGRLFPASESDIKNHHIAVCEAKQRLAIDKANHSHQRTTE